MKNLILLSTLIACMSWACSDDDDLTPTPVKNWFKITEKENMDAVDQKIYDIYKEYGIAIFYNDTLGYEDRGRRDSAGNVIYYYEVLKLDFDLTGGMGSVMWERVDVSTPEQKERLLPMIDFLDATIIPFANSMDIYIPSVIITEWYNTSNADQNVYHGFNYFNFSLENFSEENKATYLLDFINLTAGDKIEEEALTEYYDLPDRELRSAFPILGSINFWGSVAWTTGRGVCPEFATWRDKLWELENYDSLMNARLESKVLYEAQIAAGEIAADAPEYQAVLDSITYLNDEVLAKADEIQANYDTYCPQAYGILGLTTINEMIPSKEDDLEMYMAAVFSYTTEEFETLYGKFPIVIERFKMLKQVLIESGFDVDGIVSSL